jgi:hypothetical protein
MDATTEKNAARYLWLRDHAYLNSSDCEADMVALARKLACMHGESADALIDAEMAKQEA